MADARDRKRQAALAPNAVLVIAVIFVIGAGIFFAPFLLNKHRATTSVAAAQTPRSLITIKSFTVPPHKRACMSSVTVTPNSRIAQFEPFVPKESANGGPPLEFLFTGPGYRAAALLPEGYGIEGEAEEKEAKSAEERERPVSVRKLERGKATERPAPLEKGEEHERVEKTAKGAEGEAVEERERSQERELAQEAERHERGESKHRTVLPQTVSITPPRRSLIGTACFINMGTTAVLLDGSNESRLAGRSSLSIAGKPVSGNVALAFLNDHRQSRLSLLGEVIGHISNLTDHLIPAWLIWIVLVMTVFGMPVAIAAAFFRALREDELAFP